MTNMVFAPFGSLAFYLAPVGWVEPFYWALSVACRQRYRAMYGTVSRPAAATHLSDFHISPPDLLAALARCDFQATH